MPLLMVSRAELQQLSPSLPQQRYEWLGSFQVLWLNWRFWLPMY